MAAAEPARVRPVDLVAEALRGTDEIVAVTGATGWFGGVALDLLYEALGDQAATRVVGYASSAREVTVSDGRTVGVRPLVDLVSQDPPPTTLLHFAFLTRDKVAALGIDAYTSQNVAITATVRDAGCGRRLRDPACLQRGRGQDDQARAVCAGQHDRDGQRRWPDRGAGRGTRVPVVLRRRRSPGACCVGG